MLQIPAFASEDEPSENPPAVSDSAPSTPAGGGDEGGSSDSTDVSSSGGTDASSSDGTDAGGNNGGEHNYATADDLNTAFEAVGETDDVHAALSALDAYIAVYRKMSSEDQATNAEALAAAMAYQQTLLDSSEGEPESEIETLAAKWHTVTLLPASTNSYSSKIISAKVRMGQKVNGCEVTSVSGTTIKVKAYGDLYGDFFLPRAADL